MDEKLLNSMRQVIEAKKQKSASQGNDRRAPDKIGGARVGIKKHKKGGLFDK
ncbi:MAG: hypothetical protein M0Z55_05180 [Peptococcaceae bacterium]|nr:hypothetical protein [Peptococcaceae bacterium]